MLKPYLAALRPQIDPVLRESRTSGATQARYVLGHLLAEQNSIGPLREKALTQYAAIQPSIAAVLGETPQALRSRLDAQSSGDPSYEQVQLVMQELVGLLADRPDDEAQDLIQRLIRIERELFVALQQNIEAAFQSGQAAPTASEPLSDEQKKSLSVRIRREFSSESGVEVGETRKISGGFSKQTIHVTLKGARKLPASVILRIDKAQGLVGTAVKDEYQTIRVLFDAGMPVPEPYFLETDADILGGAFVMVSCVDGNTVGDAHGATQPSARLALSLAGALARMHDIPPEKFSGLPGAGTTTTARMLADIAGFEQRWRATGRTSVSLEYGLHWLKRNIAKADGRRSLVHQDVGCHNMLVKEGGVSALLDWETAVIGNPAQDLGYVYHTIAPMMPWSDFLKAYEAAGGAVPAAEQIQYYRIWRAVWNFIIVNQAAAYFESGLTSDIAMAYASTYHLIRLEMALREVLADPGE